MSQSSDAIKETARELGFSAVGIVPAEPCPQLDAYLRWVERGMHGSMEYMARSDRIARRRDLGMMLPGARSLIVVVLDYGSRLPPAALDPTRGRISNYAWGQDYHPVMKRGLNALAALARSLQEGTKAHAYVDTTALFERWHASQAGFGFVGKNTMLIHPRKGSSFFLGEVITTLALDYDEPAAERMPGCGSCTRCLAACPTKAFPQPYVLDARRCISYLTIEHQGAFDRALRPQMGNWVYGCDVCQDVCPWQRFAKPAGRAEFEPVDDDRAAPRLEDLLRLTPQAFERRFAGSAISRIGRDKLVGNACIAAGNSGHPELAGSLAGLLAEPNPVIRSHAAWALGSLGAEGDALLTALRRERDEDVRREIEDALSRL